MSASRARSVLEEYLGAQSCDDATFVQIQSKSLRPDQQQIYLVLGLPTKFAIKLNLTDQGPQSLETEFDNLRRLSPHFADQPGIDLTVPYHLSHDKHALITEYCEVRPLRENIQHAQSPVEMGQIMENAGRWLAHFHTVSDQSKKQVWPGWMIKKAQMLANSRERSPADNKLAEQAIQSMTALVPDLKGRISTFGTIHKDLNSANILVDKITAVGLDLSMVDQGLQLLDLAYLLCDVDIFQGLEAEPRVLPLQEIRDGFLKGYGTEVDQDLLNFAIKMSLLFIWLRISPQRLAASRNLRERNDHLRERIRLLARVPI